MGDPQPAQTTKQAPPGVLGFWRSPIEVGLIKPMVTASSVGRCEESHATQKHVEQWVKTSEKSPNITLFACVYIL